MQNSLVKLRDQVVRIEYPCHLQNLISTMFGHHFVDVGTIGHSVSVEQTDTDSFLFERSSGGKELLSTGDLPEFLMEAVLDGLVTDLDCGVALHAGAVAHGDKSIIVAGTSGAGKSTLTAWLVQNGFEYLTDELVVLPQDSQEDIAYFTRSLTLRNDSLEVIDADVFGETNRIEYGGKRLLDAPARSTSGNPSAGLLLFPRFVRDAELQISPLSAGSAALRLLENNLNGRNLADGGLSTVAELARNTPAFALTYGDTLQLEGVVDHLLRHVLDTGLDAKSSEVLFSAFNPTGKQPVPVVRQAPPDTFPVNEPTPPRGAFKLTIGMATYDDYDGVYFTIQSLRINNAELMDQIEILVVDNHPDGPCAADLKALENAAENLRYIPFLGQSGTAVRDFIFAQASGEFVLCLDCHVLLIPGALERLVDYIDANPQTDNLLQGPLVNDTLALTATHFDPAWRDGMYGVWVLSDEMIDKNAEPFEIPMQGLGVFACRRETWPGFNPKFKGFGGEEGYIHEKYRQRGDRTLCLPFLQWVHRFSRPMGVPYSPTWHDRIRNYTIGFRELGLDTKPIAAHFEELIGADETQIIVEEVEQELASPFNRFGAISCINLDSAQDRWSKMSDRFDRLGIGRLVARLPAIATPDNHHIGCALSHRSIIQQARQRSLPNVLVFEDDAIFHADTVAMMSTVLDELESVDWDILYLGGHSWGNQFELLPDSSVLERAEGITCIHAIAYNHSVFDRLLADIPGDIDGMSAWLQTHLGIDQYFAGLNAKMLVTRPMLSMQRELLPTLKPEQQALFVI
ncbi:MAG: glycosyltransferase [Hyphomicrobiales bacterium]|nr:glycosyltransferase [Hyphomicrobiales bacterium]